MNSPLIYTDLHENDVRRHFYDDSLSCALYWAQGSLGFKSRTCTQGCRGSNPPLVLGVCGSNPALRIIFQNKIIAQY